MNNTNKAKVQPYKSYVNVYVNTRKNIFSTIFGSVKNISASRYRPHNSDHFLNALLEEVTHFYCCKAAVCICVPTCRLSHL